LKNLYVIQYKIHLKITKPTKKYKMLGFIMGMPKKTNIALKFRKKTNI